MLTIWPWNLVKNWSLSQFRCKQKTDEHVLLNTRWRCASLQQVSTTDFPIELMHVDFFLYRKHAHYLSLPSPSGLGMNVIEHDYLLQLLFLASKVYWSLYWRVSLLVRMSAESCVHNDKITAWIVMGGRLQPHALLAQLQSHGTVQHFSILINAPVIMRSTIWGK